jgi:hypothetical protein
LLYQLSYRTIRISKFEQEMSNNELFGGAKIRKESI